MINPLGLQNDNKCEPPREKFSRRFLFSFQLSVFSLKKLVSAASHAAATTARGFTRTGAAAIVGHRTGVRGMRGKGREDFVERLFLTADTFFRRLGERFGLAKHFG
jgi:hypothetical protein